MKEKYLNGKINGKVKKYYNNNKLLFEGEYLNGKINGKSKVYYNNGKLLYITDNLNGKIIEIKEYNKEGNIINELKDGKGKMNEYNENDDLIFEGEYLNGKRSGKGKEYDIYGNLIYEGEYLNDDRSGKGKEYYFNDKIRFEGEYLFGRKWNVKEFDQNGNIIYELKNGKSLSKNIAYIIILFIVENIYMD